MDKNDKRRLNRISTYERKTLPEALEKLSSSGGNRRLEVVDLELRDVSQSLLSQVTIGDQIHGLVGGESIRFFIGEAELGWCPLPDVLLGKRSVLAVVRHIDFERLNCVLEAYI